MDYVFAYYQLSWDNVVPILGYFYQNEVADVLLGFENAWPLQTVEWHQIELTPSIAIIWLFMCHNVESNTHRTTFTNPMTGFINHLVRRQKIDLATFIYNQMHTMGTQENKRCPLIFSSSVDDICKAVGVTILSGEAPEKSNPFIKRTTLEAQDRAREKHQEKMERDARKQQPADLGQAAEDVQMSQLHHHLLMLTHRY